MIEPQILLIAAIITGACGTVLGIVGSILGVRVSKDKQTWQAMMDADKTEKEEKVNVLTDRVSVMKEDVRNVYGTIGKFLGNFHVYCEVSEYQPKLYELKSQVQEYTRLKEKQEACEKEKVVFKELRGKLINFAKLYQFDLGSDYVTALNQLQTKAAEYQMAESAYKEVFTKKEVFEKAQEKSFWSRQFLCPYSVEELNAMIAEADEKIEECKLAKVQYTKQLEELQEQLDLYDEKQIELQELHLSQEKDVAKYNLLKVTQHFLQMAKEQFTSRYMESIAKGFAKYYGKLTGDTGENWMIDANINLRVKEQGELRETHWLSAGYQDLIGVCMRFALVDAMYQEEKPFLILDDPFVNLDQEKVEAGNELLVNVSKEYQVIYFTCHDSRSPI